MRRSFRWPLLVLLTITGTVGPVGAQAPSADSSAARAAPASPDIVYRTGLSDRATTVPLPNGRGVFYLRSGTPGGVRIRSRTGSGSAAPSGAVAEPEVLREVAAEGGNEPLSRVDLLRMELALRRDLDAKIGQLIPLLADRGRTSPATPGAPTYVLPSGQAPGTVVLPRTGQAALRLQPDSGTPELGASPSLGVSPSVGPATAEEVERAILETGLFRATTVNFEFNKSDLLPSARRTLDVVGEVLARYPELLIGIGGHTDNVGPEAYNLQLSQRRADAVREYLLRAFPGLAPERVEARGYGESRPIVENTNPTTRTLNRRVEFVVLNPAAAEEYRVAPPPTDREALRRQLRQLIDEELRFLQRPVPADTTGGR